MERITKYIQLKVLQVICIIIFFCISFSLNISGQQLIKSYSIKNGKMQIKISKQISDLSLDSFINKHEFYELDLKTLLKNNNTDSILKLGWFIEENSKDLLIMSKPFSVFEKLKNPTESIVIGNTKSKNNIFINNAKYGFNIFKNKKDYEINDSKVTFF